MPQRNKLLITCLLIVLFLLIVSCAPSQQPVEQSLDDGSIIEDPEDSGDIVDEPDEEQNDTGPIPSSTSGELITHFIDVGQGDAILIQTPEQNILIDGGERGDTVVNYLQAQGVTSLDIVIGTHPHADHIGGLVNVLQAIPVKEVIDPAVVHTSKTFEDYLGLPAQAGKPLK
jgi:competence protein ComEC